MPASTAKDLKVCRTCSTVAVDHQERCAACHISDWGYVPEELAHSIDTKALRTAQNPIKLAGYRSEDWPPRDFLLRAEELQSIPEKDPEVAALLASLPSILGIWGVGHFYAGKSIGGVLLILAGVAAWALFVILTLMWHHGAVGYTFLALAIAVGAWQTSRAFNVGLERNRLRDSIWTSLRKSLGNQRNSSEYTPGRL